MNLNRTTLIGNITSDIELRSTPAGKSVATLSIATNEKYKDSSGVMQQDTEYHNCVAWGKLAEIVSQYARKGAKVFAEGKLKTRSWDDPSGQKKYKTEIILSNVILLDKKESGNYGTEESLDDMPF